MQEVSLFFQEMMYLCALSSCGTNVRIQFGRYEREMRQGRESIYMRSAGFQMKRFYVGHDRSSMRVGTDGVLLGAWCPPVVRQCSCMGESEGRLCTHEGGVGGCRPLRVLDVGTGCGLIALMLAQRIEEKLNEMAVSYKGADGQQCDWKVDGIDIDEESVRQAAENFVRSPWSNHLRACPGDVRTWELEVGGDSGVYNLVVSNPPFYNDALACPNERRARARQAGLSLGFEELTAAAARLMVRDGMFGVIVPASEEERMVRAALASGLYVSKRCVVYTKQGGAAHRVMMAFEKESRDVQEMQMVLSEPGKVRSEAYQQLTEAFYL